MPELPEVETTRRGLSPHLLGAEVRGVVVRNPHLRKPVPESLLGELPGRQIDAIERRGKYLLLHCGTHTLLIHLGMSGSLRLAPLGETPRKHDHIDLEFDSRVLRYHDPRRFGLMDWWEGDIATHPLIAVLGVEPLSDAFTGGWLHRATRNRKTPIKQLIMDGHIVVGVGNIYASESLFRAGIRPTAEAGKLSLARCLRLAGAIRETLGDAISAGGSTLRDYVNGEGNPGYFQQSVFVYARSGEACRVCGQPIRQQVQGQRATFWCPGCQH